MEAGRQIESPIVIGLNIRRGCALSLFSSATNLEIVVWKPAAVREKLSARIGFNN